MAPTCGCVLCFKGKILDSIEPQPCSRAVRMTPTKVAAPHHEYISWAHILRLGPLVRGGVARNGVVRGSPHLEYRSARRRSTLSLAHLVNSLPFRACALDGCCICWMTRVMRILGRLSSAILYNDIAAWLRWDRRDIFYSKDPVTSKS